MIPWNIPEISELDVRLTASQGKPGTVEAAGFIQNGWNDPTYDTALYEKVSADCYIPAKASVQS
jgi:hypothetical protein